MPNFIKNWKYKQIKEFLNKNNFVIYNIRGSHHYFVNGPRVVCVPFHSSKSIKPKTMLSIIKQSGILKEKWLEK